MPYIEQLISIALGSRMNRPWFKPGRSKSSVGSIKPRDIIGKQNWIELVFQFLMNSWRNHYILNFSPFERRKYLMINERLNALLFSLNLSYIFIQILQLLVHFLSVLSQYKFKMLWLQPKLRPFGNIKADIANNKFC